MDIMVFLFLVLMGEGDPSTPLALLDNYATLKMMRVEAPTIYYTQDDEEENNLGRAAL
jgi:hypothetical protein